MRSSEFNKFPQYVLIFAALSFGGWITETVFFYLYYGKLYDRGFLTLPFCTIYGFSLILLYFLIGTPSRNGPLLVPIRSSVVRGVLYFLLSMLIPTFIELITGIFFDRLFHLRLWTYTNYRFHFRGDICLEYALLWGILIPFCMEWLFLPLLKRIQLFSDQTASILSKSTAVVLTIDWASSFVKL